MADNYQNDPGRTGAKGGAQVYQEKSKGLPWWVWLLLGLALLGLLLALLRPHGPQQAAAPPAPVVADTTGQDIKVHSGTDITTAKPPQASVPGVPLSNVVMFAAATDPISLVGRKAKLTDVPVQKVLSDRAFFVGPTAQQQILVLLDKGMDAGASGGSKVTIAAGKPVSLIGVMEKMPTQEAISQQYQISGSDYTAIQTQKAYLHATVAQQK